MFFVDHARKTRSGGRQNIVNLTLDGDAVKEDPVAMAWPETLPQRGVLRFDFVALGVSDDSRFANGIQDDETFAATLRDVGSRRLTPRERREALEQARRDRAFTCAQAAALLETFDVGESRVEAASMLLPRLIKRGRQRRAKVDGGSAARRERVPREPRRDRNRNRTEMDFLNFGV
jgi:hypothetical protein